MATEKKKLIAPLNTGLYDGERKRERKKKIRERKIRDGHWDETINCHFTLVFMMEKGEGKRPGKRVERKLRHIGIEGRNYSYPLKHWKGGNANKIGMEDKGQDRDKYEGKRTYKNRK